MLGRDSIYTTNFLFQWEMENLFFKNIHNFLTPSTFVIWGFLPKFRCDTLVKSCIHCICCLGLPNM